MRKPRSAKQKAARIQPKREASEARASRLARSQRIRPLTDLGNAERLVAAHGSDMLFAPFVDKHGKWFVWDGIRWRKDDRAQVRQFAKRVVRSIPQESKNAKVRKWAKNSEARAKLEAMILLAESEPGKIILPSEWDSDPFLLNVLSGTVDLRTQRLLPHNRDDLISKLAPVQFDPGAACPRWLRFLNQIMAGNADLIAFLRRIIGYSLTGDVREQCLFFLYGTGANGKTTFLEVIRALFGDYSRNSDFSTFLTHHYESIRNDLARLFGARFVSAVEAEQGKRIAEVLLKQLTGGDPVTARFLYNEFFEYYPTFKIFLAANHPPAINETEVAIWRRLHIIPFNVTIPPAQRDKQLPDKLRTEMSGILNWAIEGCREWLKNGLGVPEEVRAATGEHRDAMDSVRRFVRECCTLDPSNKVETRALFDAYRHWCEEEEEQPTCKVAFSKRFGDPDLGFEHVTIGREGKRGIGGLRLKPANSNGADAADSADGRNTFNSTTRSDH